MRHKEDNLAKYNIYEEEHLHHFEPAVIYTIGMQAEVRLPGIFSDKMVLQRDTPIPLWGFADPKETVVIEFNGKQYKTRASQTGEWAVNLQKHKAGGPYELRVNQKIIQDVYVGDVYPVSYTHLTLPTTNFV